MNVFLTNFPLFNYVLFILILTNDFLNFIEIINWVFVIKVSVGTKILETPAHFISSPRPTPKRKKCPRTNKEGLNCQETLPRTILFSANRNHGRRKRYATKGSFPGRPNGKHRSNKTAMGE